MADIERICKNDMCYCTGDCKRSAEEKFKFKQYEAMIEAMRISEKEMKELEEYLKRGKL